MKLISLIVLILPFFISAQTSSLEKITLKKDKEIAPNTKPIVNRKTIPEENVRITKVETVNEITTYLIKNNKVRRELFFNSALRDKITALPGFFELGDASR